MLPFALFGLLAFALLVLGPPGTARTRADAAIGRRERSPGRRLGPAGLLIVLGGWFLVEAAVLSLSKGIVHPYYVSALGPGVAAMVGAGAYAFGEFARRRDWRLLLLPCAVAATVPVQLSLLHKAHYMAWFTAPLIAVAVVGALRCCCAAHGAAGDRARARRAADRADGLLGDQLAGARAVDVPGGRPARRGRPGRRTA